METQPFFSLKDCASLIRDLGFPIFVAVYVLIVTSKQTRLLTAAINRLTNAFERANIFVNHHQETPP